MAALAMLASAASANLEGSPDMMLSSGDKSVVSNLRLQYGDALLPYADETIAKAWREYSLSDEYTLRDEQPELFLEWTEMVHAEA